MTTSRRRGISPLLIAAAALLLGVLAYGFTAQATVVNSNNLAGGQNSALGAGFSIETNSVTYNFDGIGPNTGGQVNEVSFNAVALGANVFSTNAQVFVRAEGTQAYNQCGTGGATAPAPADNFARTTANPNTIQANRCNFPAIAINNVGFGLYVIIVE